MSAALRSLDEALAAAGEAADSETLPEPQFRLERQFGQDTDDSSSNSSLFSSRSWQDKITRGELTALVSEKSRSVQDLMVLTHVEPLSDVEFQQSKERDHPISFNLGPQISVTCASSEDLGESDEPLLNSTDADSAKCALLSATESYVNRNRSRLTSTPLQDTDFQAMETRYTFSIQSTFSFLARFRLICKPFSATVDKLCK